MNDQPLFSTLPDSRAARWETLRKFAEVWNIPWETRDRSIDEELDHCEKRLGHSLPAALREWYRIKPYTMEDWSGGRWLPPDQLRLNDERNLLVICIDEDNESDPDWFSGISLDDLAEDDPPVWHVDDLLNRCTKDGESFSVHIIRQAFVAAKSRCEILTISDIDDLLPATLFALNTTLCEQFTPTDLGTGQYSIGNQTVIHESPGMLAFVCRSCTPKYLEVGYLYLCFRKAADAEPIPARLGREMAIWSASPGRTKYLAPTRRKIPQDVIASDAAEMAKRTAELLQAHGFGADFTLENLSEIDRYFEEHSQDGLFRPNGPLSTLAVPRVPALGAYLGETILRNVGGRWNETKPRPEQVLYGGPETSLKDLTLELNFDNGGACWPISRVRKRFLYGEDEGIAAYGRQIADAASEGR